MELNKNYPWLNNLKVSDQKIQDWQDKSKKSLTFWALRNKSIEQKAYFDWAIDHYQMPFLKDIYFEQNLMTKKQWEEIQEAFDWSEEILPVALWNGTIFIGCVEPIQKEIEIFGFDTRFVLISYQSMQVMWKFVQSLSKFIEKEVTRSIAISELQQLHLNPDIPVKKPLDHPVSPALVKKQSSLNPDIPVKKPLDHPVSPALVNLEKRSSLPELEEDRASEDNNTDFPARDPVEDNILVMKESVRKKEPTIAQDNGSSEHTQFTMVGGLADKTATQMSISSNYEELWKYTKSFYCASMILRVKEEKVYPMSWSGKIKCQTDGVMVDLNDYSLFKILTKGYSYNGFVVDNPVNKKFFSEIGWSEYPKHVTAIPIKDSNNQIQNVFLGLSLKPISRGKVQQVEGNILQFFKPKNEKISKVA